MPKKENPKISVSVRMDLETHARIHQIAEDLSIDGDSQLYRWVIDWFLKAVDSPPVKLPEFPVLEIAQKINFNKGSGTNTKAS